MQSSVRRLQWLARAHCSQRTAGPTLISFRHRALATKAPDPAVPSAGLANHSVSRTEVPTEGLGTPVEKPLVAKAKRKRAPPKKKAPPADTGVTTVARRGPKPRSTIQIPPGVDLPPMKDWGAINVAFSSKPLWGRFSVSNPETADKLANAFIPEGSVGKIVIEAYPGPGQLTRSLLKLPRERISKIIVMEPIEGFLEWLRPLEALDDRLTIMAVDPYVWTAYDQLVDNGHLANVPITDWNSGPHPTLHFIQQLPSVVIGEQLLNQYIRTIPDRHWLFKYGRIPLDLIMSLRMWQRVSATTEEKNQRCKVGVLREATSNVYPSIPLQAMEPYEDHFFPPPSPSSRVDPSNKQRLESRKAGHAHMAMRLEAMTEPLINAKELDYWDFVTRKLFISKATPLTKTMQILAPGAGSLLKALTDPNLPPEKRLDVTKAPRKLTAHDWKLIVEAFSKWPFRPENLSIDVDLVPRGRKL